MSNPQMQNQKKVKRDLLRQDRQDRSCLKDRDHGQLFDFEKDPFNHINFWDDPEYADIKIEMRHKLLNRLMSNQTQPDTRLAQW